MTRIPNKVPLPFVQGEPYGLGFPKRSMENSVFEEQAILEQPKINTLDASLTKQVGHSACEVVFLEPEN